MAKRKKKYHRNPYEHFPRSSKEMLAIMSSAFSRPVDDPELKLTCRFASKTLKEYGQVIFFRPTPSGKGGDPLIFTLANRGSREWLRQRTKEERDAWYASLKKWSKKKRKKGSVEWKTVKK